MIEDYEKNLENWLETLNWSENPFTLKIDPVLFVGYREQLKKLTNHIREGHKVGLVTGSTGSGKTTLMKLMEKDLHGKYDVLYISKPPRKEDLLDLFLSRYRPSFFERIFGSNVRLHDIHVYMNKKLGNKRLVVLLDETHEADIEVLKWFRTITDQINNMQLILAGLSTVDDVLRANLETLRSRIVTKVELINLTREESRELIEKRISSVGGEGIKPFTETSVKEIYEKTGGFPREILKMCDKMVQKAVEENIFEISHISGSVEKSVDKPKEIVESEVVEDVNTDRKRESPVRDLNNDFMSDLSYKQKKIIKLLNENAELFPSEIAEKIGFEKYKTKQHAVRSVNNILKRLSKSGYVERKPKGKGFVYFLNLKTKNLLIKS